MAAQAAKSPVDCVESRFPLYITHYPLIYVYTAWVAQHVPATRGIPAGLLLFGNSMALTYMCLKFFDFPNASLNRQPDSNGEQII